MKDWLLVVDVQPAFLDPQSPWFSAMLPDAIGRIDALVAAFGTRALFTRFVPPDTATGSWEPYYAKWGFALRSEAAALWQVAAPWTDRPSVASHRFSKWAEARPILGPDAHVTICGVSTDCRVLSTALAAVDDGAHVRIAADACAAGDLRVHDQALAILASRAPQLVITTVDAERRRLAATMS